MKKDIAGYVAECIVCQRYKASSLTPAGLLQPLPIPQQVWAEISMDFVEGLPTSGKMDTILVVVDRLTKYAHFLAFRHPFSAITVAQIFFEEVVRLHGIPEVIVSDRGNIFMSQFWKTLFQIYGTRLHKSSSYHPQTDGQTEVVNRCLETYLRCFAGDKPRTWSKWLGWAEFWYNTTHHSTIKTTPFRALYGRDPPTLLRQQPRETPLHSLDVMLEERDLILAELQANIARAHQIMSSSANKKRRELEFKVGDLVFLKLQPYRMKTLAKRKNEKLSPRFYGPYYVLQRVGKVAYKLQLPADAQIHPVFHISQLKQAVGDHSNFQPKPLPSTLTHEMELIVQPETLIAIRKHKVTNDIDVLIQWKNMPTCDQTWESFDTMCEQFPEFHLEDKVNVWAGSIDVYDPRYKNQYSRRRRNLMEMHQEESTGSNMLVEVEDQNESGRETEVREKEKAIMRANSREEN